jgi:hypothetical protein
MSLLPKSILEIMLTHGHQSNHLVQHLLKLSYKPIYQLLYTYKDIKIFLFPPGSPFFKVHQTQTQDLAWPALQTVDCCTMAS